MRSAPADPPDLSTSQRVLEVSATLFNQRGIEGVSIGQIAEGMGISPGNLTYHYRRKSDLVAAHIDQFEARLKERLAPLPVATDPRTATEVSVNLLRLALAYRFLFIGANYILQRELVCTDRYHSLLERAKQGFVLQLRQYQLDKVMRAVPAPYSLEVLVENIWRQWLGWLLNIQIIPPQERPPEGKLLTDAVLHLLFLVHPYLDASFFKQLQAELRRLGKKLERA